MKPEVYSFVRKEVDLKIRALEKEKKLYIEEEFERKKKEARKRYDDLMKEGMVRIRTDYFSET